MSWVANFNFPTGAKFCFGSHACQVNEDGDLVPIQPETQEEPQPTPSAHIYFGLPEDWRSRLTKSQEITKMMEDLYIGGETESEGMCLIIYYGRILYEIKILHL